MRAPDGATYRYAALPFGLKTAPFLYQGTMKAAVDAIARRTGIAVCFYMDDFLVSSNDPDTARRHCRILIAELQNLGWRINLDKCKLEPSTSVRFLGYVWDSEAATCSLPNERR